jgi:hypothetical protein
MFDVLNDCFFKYIDRPQELSKSVPLNPGISQEGSALPKPSPKRTLSVDQDECAIPANLPDLDSFKYMTLAEAARQHKLFDKSGKIVGDLKTAYKCFEEYANYNQTNASNQIKAKYYKAYYISRDLVKLDISNEKKDEVVAKLFKEVADDDTNEFPEAKLRYGDCLYHGKGVDQDLPKALEYFEKAADDGFKVAMYNAGKLYWNGCNGKINVDKEKAITYMKFAIYHEYEPAIRFCKDNNIDVST